MEKKSMKVKSTKVVIEIPNQPELRLTVEQAKELRDLLCTNFPDRPWYYHVPWNPPCQIWTDTSGGYSGNIYTSDSTNPPQNMQITMEEN